MSSDELAFLPKNPTNVRKVLTGRTYFAISKVGDYMSIDYQAGFKDDGEVVTGVIIRQIKEITEQLQEDYTPKEMVEMGYMFDAANKVFRKNKIFYPTHNGMAAADQVLKHLDETDFFATLAKAIEEKYNSVLDVKELRTTVLIHTPIFDSSSAAPLREPKPLNL